MKKNMMLVVLSAVLTVLPISKAGGLETPLFFDDFESSSLGTFPSAGGWILVWNGQGNQYQLVTDAYSFSPTRSLQLWGRPNWASLAQRKFSTNAPVIGYEFAIRIDSIGTGKPGREEHPGFFSKEAYIWGAYYAYVRFNHDDRKIKAEDSSILGNWEPGVWYKVKVVLDRSTNTYKVWIDGQLKGQGLSTSRSDAQLINSLALISAHPGVKVYYDDVRVFEVETRKASNPYPADGATSVPVDAALSWTPGDTAVSHDVYFGTNQTPGPSEFMGRQTATEYRHHTALTPGIRYHWRIDEVEVDGITKHTGDLWSFTTGPAKVTKATNPYPVDGAIHVGPNVLLSWSPGFGATSHDVYFGTNFDAVANADKFDTTGIYRGRQAVDANSYAPGRLELGQTCYWRTDAVIPAVDGPPIVAKGDVWGFMRGVVGTLPQLTGKYRIVASNGKEGEWKTVTEIDPMQKGTSVVLHFDNDPNEKKKKFFQLTLIGIAAKDLDLLEVKGYSGQTVIKPKKKPRPVFSGTHKGFYMKSWGYRFGPPQPDREEVTLKATKDIPGGSVKVIAESMCCQLDATPDWIWPLSGSFGADGSGAESGAARVTAVENYTLRFWDASFGAQSPGAVIGVPRVTTIYLFPDSSEVNTLIPPYFSADPSTGNWTASFVYADHDGNSRPNGGVRFVSDGPGLGTSDRFAFEVSMIGPIDSVYELYAHSQDSSEYMVFVIDVVDTPECTNVVDDMESYNNLPPSDPNSNRICKTWENGGTCTTSPKLVYLGNGTGSIVDINSVFVHEGMQSMKFSYDNTGTRPRPGWGRIACYSETTANTDGLEIGGDWTRQSIKALSLWFCGVPGNAAEQLYVALEDTTGNVKVVNHPDPTAVQIDTWQEWNIDLLEFIAGGVNLANIKKIHIGVGDRDNPQPGGTGIVYFDDISLCPLR